MPAVTKHIKSWVDLGIVMHTAMRKYCDSVEASLAWNLISMESKRIDEAWEQYLREAHRRLSTKMPKIMPVKLGDLIVELDGSIEEIKRGQHESNALRCALELLTEQDWAGIGLAIYGDRLTDEKGEDDVKA